MGVLHDDIEKVLYSQDAIAEAVSQLGEYVQQLTVNKTTKWRYDKQVELQATRVRLCGYETSCLRGKRLTALPAQWPRRVA